MVSDKLFSAKTESQRQPMLWLVVIYCMMIFAAWFVVPHPAVGIAIALLPIAILVTINSMFWLIVLFVLFSFFRLHEVMPLLMPFKLPFLLSLGALASLMWYLFVDQSLKPYWHPTMKWLFAFWFSVILSVIFASNRPMAMSNFQGIYWKIMVMTVAIIWVVNNKQNLAKISWAISVTGAIVGSVAIYNSIMGIGLVEGSRVTIGRAIGSMLGDPNDLALVLLFPLAFACSLCHNATISGWLRLCGGIISLLLMIAIIATQSRGGLLGMVAVCGYFMAQVIRSKVLLATIGVIGLLALYVMAGISSRASGGAAEAGVDASAMGRLYAWEAAFKMALDNPMTGVGLNNFYVNYFFYSPHWDGLNHAVHSTWFGVLAETGFLGLILFLGLIFSLIKTATTSIKKLQTSPDVSRRSNYLLSSAYAVLAGLYGTVVSGTFLTQGFVWPIYILTALIISISKISEK